MWILSTDLLWRLYFVLGSRTLRENNLSEIHFEVASSRRSTFYGSCEGPLTANTYAAKPPGGRLAPWEYRFLGNISKMWGRLPKVTLPLRSRAESLTNILSGSNVAWLILGVIWENKRLSSVVNGTLVRGSLVRACKHGSVRCLDGQTWTPCNSNRLTWATEIYNREHFVAISPTLSPSVRKINTSTESFRLEKLNNDGGHTPKNIGEPRRKYRGEFYHMQQLSRNSIILLEKITLIGQLKPL